MAKMYTLDKKLLVGSPEIRIGDEILPVDDRKKNVEKILKLYKDKDVNTEDKISEDDLNRLDEVVKLALGKDGAKKVDAMNLSWAAYQALFELIMAAVTGEEPENLEERFPEKKQ